MFKFRNESDIVAQCVRFTAVYAVRSTSRLISKLTDLIQFSICKKNVIGAQYDIL